MKYNNPDSSHFVLGEPSGGDQNCFGIDSENGYWSDFICSIMQSFVCKSHFLDNPPNAATTKQPPEVSDCGSGWQENENTGVCYMIVDLRMSFSDAQLHCQELYYSDEETQPTLVSFSDVREQMFVEGVFSECALVQLLS